MHPERLRVEYLENPRGIDEPFPRFFWVMSDDRRGAGQTAYQLEVTAAGKTVWDSGKGETDTALQIVYNGRPLAARTRYEWRVRLWDMDGSPGDWSHTAWFETGLTGDWAAQWIRGSNSGSYCQPASYFRKEFSLKSKPRKARLYTTALGLYMPCLNGAPATDNCFMPGWTDYYKRVQYQAYDVTELLHGGGNAIGIILNEGWFCGQISRLWSTGIVNYGDRPAFLAQLEVELEDGSTQTITSGSDWRFSNNGPVRASDIYMGENYDARMELPGWNCAGYDDSQWFPSVVDERKIRIDWNSGLPVRRIEERKPVLISQPSPGIWVVDMGQNITGREKMVVRNAPAGTEIYVKHGEMLKNDGTVYIDNLRGARAATQYIAAGGAEEIYEPLFTFYGFRYLEISGWPGGLTEDQISCYVIHSDMERTGWFECSDPLLNKLYENAWWGHRDNYLDVPTDCPQRDERLAWTGDTQVFARSAAYNADVAAFFTKWLEDLDLSRNEDGEYPQYAPFYRKDGFVGAAGWADAGLICPWVIWEMYGDKRVLEKYFDSMLGWIKFVEKQSDNLISSQARFKDHLNINAETPADLVGTAFFAGMAELLSRIAAIIGRNDEAEKLLKLFTGIKQAYVNRFISPSGELTVKTQAAAVLTLYFKLAPDEFRQQIVDYLVHDIVVEHDTHLSTGFLGTPYLAHVLSDNGRADIAYALLLQQTCPSWLFPVTQGATTFWERWNSWTKDSGCFAGPMNSFNHYAFGSIIDWFYGVICGIKPVSNPPAFKHFRAAPLSGGKLDFARMVFNSPYGMIVSEWRKTAAGMTYKLAVPANTTAEVCFPASSLADISENGRPVAALFEVVSSDSGRPAIKLAAGTYEFEIILTGSE